MKQHSLLPSCFLEQHFVCTVSIKYVSGMILGAAALPRRLGAFDKSCGSTSTSPLPYFLNTNFQLDRTQL
jgi:hypothetical protein